MTCNEITLSVAEIVPLMDESFPTYLTNETRSLCRHYQGQILESLLRMDMNIAENAVYIKPRVANFLLYDGKYIDCGRWFRQVIKAFKQLLRHLNPHTLGAMNKLGWTYMQQ